MNTDLTPAEIAVRTLLWETAQNGGALSLDVDETAALWNSILKTGVELSFLRDDGRKGFKSPVTNSDVPVRTYRESAYDRSNRLYR